ncbi:MAG: type 1 glutamine amidotransferase [Micrococcales bacterium]|nr:type 1 glutamine amidotransferase [Micrococcales bacterium]
MSQPSRPRVLVIEHERNTGIDFVGERLTAAGLELVTVGPEVGVPLPETMQGYAALVVLGGVPGPSDDQTAWWLPQTRELICGAVDAGLPVLGLCLGAQLIAIACGGEVSSAAYPEVGVFEVEPLPAAADDPLLRHLRGPTPVLQWHYLEVTRLPAGAVLLARSERCAVQAFRLGDRVWALQSHPEATEQTPLEWSADGPGELAAQGTTPEAVRDAMVQHAGTMTRRWGAVADAWAQEVRGHPASGQVGSLTR